MFDELEPALAFVAEPAHTELDRLLSSFDADE
jgi:hypothetical protein